MKIVGLEIQSVEVSKFVASKNEAELTVSFNDGSARSVAKTVDLSEPVQATQALLADIKKLVLDAYKKQVVEDVSDTNVNLVFKQEESISNELPQFLTRLSQQLKQVSAKKDADGYLDLIREIKQAKVEFS